MQIKSKNMLHEMYRSYFLTIITKLWTRFRQKAFRNPDLFEERNTHTGSYYSYQVDIVRIVIYFVAEIY